MHDGSVSEQPNGRFKLHCEGDFWMLNCQKLDEEETWDLMYRFRDDWPLRLSDFQDIHEAKTYGRDKGLISNSKPMAQVKRHVSYLLVVQSKINLAVSRLREMKGKTVKHMS